MPLRYHRGGGYSSKERNGKLTYTVLRSDRKTVALQIRNGSVLVRAPRRMSEAAIRQFVTRHTEWIEKQLARLAEKERALGEVIPLTREEIYALAEEARVEIPKRVRYFAERLGIQYGRITIRNQRTRWGSCSSNGNLNFNCLLMLAPREVLDAVVVHELCHLKEMNHSKRFYEYVLAAYPEYHKWNGWLKKNGAALQRRMQG
ncbi:MAG: M48 family metallopeptidase [Clostridia bacterium]|nr:M48 family metallopeptidase [Clostridia bacterium]MBQ5833829.1 M48 family metallopeptidase [Clostridia bacterium]